MKRPDWDEYFMLTAILLATRHSCWKRGVGAVLVKDSRIIATGYNGAARGLTNCLQFGHCHYEQLALNEAKENGKNFSEIKEKFKGLHCLATHAEANAISQCSREEAKGSVLYVTNYPCPKCVRDVIITYGIKAVRVWKEYLTNPLLTIDEKRASEQKLLEAKIPVAFVPLTKERILEVAGYMIDTVGERTGYQFLPAPPTV